MDMTDQEGSTGAHGKEAEARRKAAFTNDLARAAALSPRQERAAQLKALGCSNAQIATDLQINRTTLWRWQDDVGFRLRVNQLQADSAEAAAGAFAEAVWLAVDLLKKEVEKGNAQAAAQIVRLVGPNLARAYSRRRPTEPQEMLAALRLERAERASLSSTMSSDEKVVVLKHLDFFASTEFPEEVRDRMLMSAAARMSQLGRSPEAVPAQFTEDQIQRTMELLSERTEMLLRASWLIGTEYDIIDSRLEAANEALTRADDLLLREDGSPATNAETIQGLSHLAKVVLILADSVQNLVDTSRSTELSEARSLAASAEAAAATASGSSKKLIPALRHLDLAIAKAAWSIGSDAAR
jgi:hypothetical protein